MTRWRAFALCFLGTFVFCWALLSMAGGVQ